MEMVDMDIRRFWFSDPKSRSVNIFFSIQILDDFWRWIFYFEKMTFLDFFDMYLMIFDINSQYLVRFSQYLVKNNQY